MFIGTEVSHILVLRSLCISPTQVELIIRYIYTLLTVLLSFKTRERPTLNETEEESKHNDKCERKLESSKYGYPYNKAPRVPIFTKK